jgi:hypothetical protein
LRRTSHRAWCAMETGANAAGDSAAYRVGDDGKLAFARAYDVETGGKTQFWSGMVAPS